MSIIIYLFYSPDGISIRSREEMLRHLTSPGTCKCGLRCPFVLDEAFNFDPEILGLPDNLPFTNQTLCNIKPHLSLHKVKRRMAKKSPAKPKPSKTPSSNLKNLVIPLTRSPKKVKPALVSQSETTNPKKPVSSNPTQSKGTIRKTPVQTSVSYPVVNLQSLVAHLNAVSRSSGTQSKSTNISLPLLVNAFQAPKQSTSLSPQPSSKPLSSPQTPSSSPQPSSKPSSSPQPSSKPSSSPQPSSKPSSSPQPSSKPSSSPQPSSVQPSSLSQPSSLQPKLSSSPSSPHPFSSKHCSSPHPSSPKHYSSPQPSPQHSTTKPSSQLSCPSKPFASSPQSSSSIQAVSSSISARLFIVPPSISLASSTTPSPSKLLNYMPSIIDKASSLSKCSSDDLEKFATAITTVENIRNVSFSQNTMNKRKKDANVTYEETIDCRQKHNIGKPKQNNPFGKASQVKVTLKNTVDTMEMDGKEAVNEEQPGMLLAETIDQAVDKESIEQPTMELLHMEQLIEHKKQLTEPTNQPIDQPTDLCTEQPTDQPIDQCTEQPTDQPIDQPTDQPRDQPTDQPIDQCTEQPTDQPTEQPTDQPIDQPTDQPIDQPTEQPTDQPIDQPTDQPIDQCTEQPTDQPIDQSTEKPIDQSTDQPIDQCTEQPTHQPIDQPTDQPTDQHTDQHTDQPTDQHTDQPTDQHTDQHTDQPKKYWPIEQPLEQHKGQPTEQCPIVEQSIEQSNNQKKQQEPTEQLESTTQSQVDQEQLVKQSENNDNQSNKSSPSNSSVTSLSYDASLFGYQNYFYREYNLRKRSHTPLSVDSNTSRSSLKRSTLQEDETRDQSASKRMKPGQKKKSKRTASVNTIIHERKEYNFRKRKSESDTYDVEETNTLFLPKRSQRIRQKSESTTFALSLETREESPDSVFSNIGSSYNNDNESLTDNLSSNDMPSKMPGPLYDSTTCENFKAHFTCKPSASDDMMPTNECTSESTNIPVPSLTSTAKVNHIAMKRMQNCIEECDIDDSDAQKESEFGSTPNSFIVSIPRESIACLTRYSILQCHSLPSFTVGDVVWARAPQLMSWPGQVISYKDWNTKLHPPSENQVL